MSDRFGIVYREVLPQAALLDRGADGAETAAVTRPRPGQGATRQAAASASSTRMPYTESIYDAQRVVCAGPEDGECE